MTDEVWDAIWALSREDRQETLDLLFQLVVQGPWLPQAIYTDLFVRGEWGSGWQVMLLSNNIVIPFAPVEDSEGEYIEILHPIRVPWNYEDEDS